MCVCVCSVFSVCVCTYMYSSSQRAVAYGPAAFTRLCVCVSDVAAMVQADLGSAQVSESALHSFFSFGVSSTMSCILKRLSLHIIVVYKLFFSPLCVATCIRMRSSTATCP